MIRCGCCGAPLVHVEQACFNCLPGFYLRGSLPQRLPTKWIMESNQGLPPDPRDEKRTNCDETFPEGK